MSGERLENIVVIEAGEKSTNLPEGCCDAILLLHVYHHFTHPEEINRSLSASLKPGGRLAVIDFAPRRSSTALAGTPTNRGGHGIPCDVLIEELGEAGLVLEETITDWPNADERTIALVFKKQ